jgi:hypothetical protein
VFTGSGRRRTRTPEQKAEIILIKGGLPTEAMVAFVLIAKYAWHLPLYRKRRL